MKGTPKIVGIAASTMASAAITEHGDVLVWGASSLSYIAGKPFMPLKGVYIVLFFIVILITILPFAPKQQKSTNE